MYGTLNNGVVTYAPDIIRLDDVTIINPPEEVLIEQGYKPIIRTDQPESEDGFYFNSVWEEIDGVIKQVWNKIEIPELEDDILTKVNKILLGKDR